MALARSGKRHFLCAQKWLWLARFTRRVSLLEHGPLLLHQVGQGRNVGKHKCLLSSRLSREIPYRRKKKAEPTTLILDSQSVKNSATATEAVGFDGGKLIKGRKRFVLIDTTGATLATLVLPVNAHDGQSALAWWAKLAHHPLLRQVKRVFIDGGFRGAFVEQMAKQYQKEVLVPQKVVRQVGKFCVHATRWVVERSISWLTNNRRLARCYERKISNEESFILLCNIRRIISKC